MCLTVAPGCDSGGGTGTDGGGVPGVDSGPRLPDPCIAAGTCPVNTWIEVTPAGVGGDYGPGPVILDPARPSHLYFGGYDHGVWRSTDYGNTWTRRDETIDGEPGEIPAVAQGLAIAVAGTSPEATVWVARGCACGLVYRSTDGGRTYETIGTGLPEDTDLYSIVVDPNDTDHLLSGLHEADGIVESLDGGETWRLVGGTGFPTGGVSWYVDFLESVDAATTRRTWFAIAQNDGSPVITHDGGATWTIPDGLAGLTHPHGNSQMFQDENELFVAGEGGIFRSDDSGATFDLLREGNYNLVWGTESNLYATWGWACGEPCMAGPDLVVSPRPGDAWAPVATPGIGTGPQHVAITSDGEHTIFVATFWWAGIWRYVEAP